MENNSELKQSIGVKWIKVESGNTYLCPADLSGASELTEEELRQVCVDESQNPENA